MAAPATDEGAESVLIIRLLAVLFAESAHPHPPRSSAPSPSWGRLTTRGRTSFVSTINHNLQYKNVAADLLATTVFLIFEITTCSNPANISPPPCGHGI